MAEARIAVATPCVKSQDVGTASSWQDFFKTYRVILIRNYFSIRNSIRNGTWPTSIKYIVVVWGFSLYLLEMRPKFAKQQVKALMDATWLIPMPKGSPHWLRNLLFSAGTSMVFFLCWMKVRQYLLRLLLSYKAWMFEKPKHQSFITIAWGLLVRFVSGYQPSLYSFQNSLPRLPVPRLDDTLEKLLISLEPLCTETEMEEYRKAAKEFAMTQGPKLQKLLYLKSWWAPNYVTDWWEKYVYLMSRLPLAINSNYYAVDHYAWTPTHKQVSRAANVIHSLVFLKRQIDREELRPLVIRNTIPTCMMQYEKVYSSTRLPGPDLDHLQHYESSVSRHIIVSCEGLLYCLSVLDDKNQILCPSVLQTVIQEIMEDAKMHSVHVSPSEKSVPALTALPRNDWARIYKEHFDSGINADNVEIVNKAMFMVVLFNKSPDSLSDKGKQLLHADGKTLWFDKSLSICFFPDGSCGMNVEHSMADAPVPGHLWEYAMTVEVVEKRYLDTGEVMPPPKSFKQSNFDRPFRLVWQVAHSLQKEVQLAVGFSQKNASDLDLVVYNHNHFGKGVIKKGGISPDAFVQLALQLAYYRDAKGFCQTYEASAMRLFQNGRTETVRSCTRESCAFVRAVESGAHTTAELLQLLKAAADQHQILYKSAMTGKGIDRHLFALYVISRGLGYHCHFLQSVLQRPWTLSTSQQPQQQMQLDMPDINLEAFRQMVSPGGGFGPVSDNGYGVSYMLPTEYNIFFHVSSKHSSSETDSERFVGLIEGSMGDLRRILGV